MKSSHNIYKVSKAVKEISTRYKMAPKRFQNECKLENFELLIDKAEILLKKTV